ncbi:hypothetical protein [Noviherbaspirillum sp. UKPF54]|uniref:lysine 5,6-aminomutase reactivase subunit KamB n=1 Tax=Noviherbaspirillum sp. UKPF54 TaxID=2601898 RepID=UPI0011B161C1|nr:hypothetical protein [Noviherbaspirillum sp. UKPF54]QDZ27217.1 hypothetical protein FAY22_04165 [Noviherbaspirillum sp. UKPF54]
MTKSSALWNRIRDCGMTTVAVMGMTKNTGKTVCLNHLLAQARAHNTAVGITSIGRDGEERDQVFSILKPPVLVAQGCLVATARDTLLRAKVRWKQIGGTGIDSPMGEILVVRALDAGEMEIAGASRSHDQHRVIALLKQCGAGLVILDGALGRSHHASPAIADGVVLATGAAIGGGISDVLKKTRDRLAILRIDEADAALAARVGRVFSDGGVGVWNRAGDCLFSERIATLNAAGTLLALPAADIASIAVSGAVGRSLWQAVTTLQARHPGLTLVVADGTKLFIDANDVTLFAKSGGRLLSLRGIRIAGITLNPFSPFGGSFDAKEFIAAARGAFPGQVVSDVVQEEQSMLEGANP